MAGCPSSYILTFKTVAEPLVYVPNRKLADRKCQPIVTGLDNQRFVEVNQEGMYLGDDPVEMFNKS